MKLHLESTEEFATANGQRTRIWYGTTDSGIPVFAFIAAIAVEREADLAEFERDLREINSPAIELDDQLHTLAVVMRRADAR